MRRMRRSVASSSVLAGIWEAPGFVRERFVSLISFAPTEYPVLAIQLSLDWDSGGGTIRPMESLRTLVRSFPSVLLGYSGGVDSALLAVVLRQELGRDRMVAAMGRSASYPEAQWRAAGDVAERLDVTPVRIDTLQIEDPGASAYPPKHGYI